MFLLPSKNRTNRKEKVHHILVARKKERKKGSYIGEGSLAGPPLTPSKVVLAVDQENCPENSTTSQQPSLHSGIYSFRGHSFQHRIQQRFKRNAPISANRQLVHQQQPSSSFKQIPTPQRHILLEQVSTTIILYIKYFHHRNHDEIFFQGEKIPSPSASFVVFHFCLFDLVRACRNVISGRSVISKYFGIFLWGGVYDYVSFFQPSSAL